MRMRWMLAIAGTALALGCGGDDDAADDGAGGKLAPGPHAAGDGSDDGGAGGTGGSGNAGRPGSGSGTGGRSGSAGASGGAAQAGSASPGAGSGGGSGRAGEGGAEGAAGMAAADNSCTIDADCVMCNVALAPGCCPGCPAPRSKTQCDADLRAFKQRCATTNANFRPIPVCPEIECFDPGQALCEGGICIRVEQANR